MQLRFGDPDQGYNSARSQDLLKAFVCIAAGVLAVASGGCGEATDTVPAEHKSSIRAVGWRISSIHGRQLHLIMPSGYCVGHPMPKVSSVRISKEKHHRAVITVFEEFPVLDDGPPPEICLGVAQVRERTVRLPAGISKRQLYDGSQEPPVRRRV